MYFCGDTSLRFKREVAPSLFMSYAVIHAYDGIRHIVSLYAPCLSPCCRLVKLPIDHRNTLLISNIHKTYSIYIYISFFLPKQAPHQSYHPLKSYPPNRLANLQQSFQSNYIGTTSGRSFSFSSDESVLFVSSPRITRNKVRYDRGSWHRYWEQGRYYRAPGLTTRNKKLLVDKNPY